MGWVVAGLGANAGDCGRCADRLWAGFGPRFGARWGRNGRTSLWGLSAVESRGAESAAQAVTTKIVQVKSPVATPHGNVVEDVLV